MKTELNDIEIGKQGVYLRVMSSMMDGYEKTKSLDEVARRSKRSLNRVVTSGVRWTNVKVPKSEMDRMLGTMKAYKDNETGFLLAWNPTDKAYKILLPPQTNSNGCALSMDKMDKVPDGYSIIGTFHTHPHGIGAFWSGTDRADQTEQTSIHTVFSLNNDGSVRDAKCTLYIVHVDAETGKKWYTEHDQMLEDVFESTDFISGAVADAEWVEQIRKDHAKLRASVPVVPGVPGASYKTYAGYDGLFPEYYGSRFDTLGSTYGTAAPRNNKGSNDAGLDTNMVESLVGDQIATLLYNGADCSDILRAAVDNVLDFAAADSRFDPDSIIAELYDYIERTNPSGIDAGGALK